MEDKRVKLNELKSQTVRAIIDYTNEDGTSAFNSEGICSFCGARNGK